MTRAGSGAQPHPLRCETCGNHTKKGSCTVATKAVMPIVKDASHFSNGEGIYVNQSERDLIAIIGCASHTSVPAAEAQQRTCAWKEDDDGNWNTDCGHVWTFFDGTPQDNGLVFCPFCGALLRGEQHE